MSEEEIWKPVVGWEGLYEVSSLGRVRSLDRIVNRFNRQALLRGKVLKQGAGTKGHYVVSLWGEEGPKTRSVHRLVAEAFIPNPDNLPVVRHWDDVKENNHVDNLLWGTQADNMQDASRNGRTRNQNTYKKDCRKGHPLSGDNLYINPAGSRVCLTCSRAVQGRDAKRQRKERSERGLPAGDKRHGTLNGYSNYRCRCEPCKEAQREYDKNRMGRGKSE